MKKGIITLSILLSTIGFSKSDVILRPYGNIGVVLSHIPRLKVDSGIEAKTSVYKKENFDILVGGGASIITDIYYTVDSSITSYFSVYPLFEGKYSLNRKLGFYTNIRPNIGIGIEHNTMNAVIFALGVEPGVTYKNFDFGLNLGYTISSFHLGRIKNQAFNLGLNFGYNFKIN